MPTKVRVPNNIQHALTDIVLSALDLRGNLNEIRETVERDNSLRTNPRILLQLLEANDALSKIERKALYAERGEYCP